MNKDSEKAASPGHPDHAKLVIGKSGLGAAESSQESRCLKLWTTTVDESKFLYRNSLSSPRVPLRFTLNARVT